MTRPPPGGTPPAGRRLDAIVRERFGVSWNAARSWIESGKVSVDGRTTIDPAAVPAADAVLAVDPNAPRPRRATEFDPDSVVHLDTHVIVVDKPPGVSTVPFERRERGTLDERVRAYLARRMRGTGNRPRGRVPLGVVHRLDRETSGLVVFTRTWLAKQSLSEQFRAHTTERIYLAIARGDVKAGEIRSYLVADRGDGFRGSVPPPPRGAAPTAGRLSITRVEVVERLPGATLVACRPKTGRTHQIRIHLSESGHPIAGERVYVRGYDGPEVPAPRLMLHAAALGFEHPVTHARLRFERPLPEDMAGVLATLRRARGGR